MLIRFARRHQTWFKVGSRDLSHDYRPPSSGGGSDLDGSWDVIHFNFGVWDATYREASSKYFSGVNTTSVEDFEKNLRTLVAKMKETGATLIWGSVTPVWEGDPDKPNGDEDAYNRVAAKVMKENGVIINDLNAEVRRQGAGKSRNVHDVGNLAPKVTQTIVAALDARENKTKPLPRVLFIGDSITGTYWGQVAKDLDGKATVFKNPGNGEDTWNGLERMDEWLDLKRYLLNGQEYLELVDGVKKVIGDELSRAYPGYNGQKAELAGFVWFQGIADAYSEHKADEYEQNLVNLIKDLRKDFDVPHLPFVVGALAYADGMTSSPKQKIFDAQMAVGDSEKYPEFSGNVVSVDTRPMCRPLAECPGGRDPYKGNAASYLDIGDAMGAAMINLLDASPKDHLPSRPRDNAGSTQLWYEQPAKSWQREALPIGNGRLGAMIFGKVMQERIALNEDSVWSGARVDWNRDDAHKSLPRIRELLLAGDNVEAEKLVNQTFTCKGGGSRGGARGPWGCYQELGNLNIAWHSEVPAILLNKWKVKPIDVEGIKDIREQRRTAQRVVADAIRIETEDADWDDYEVADGQAVKGARRLSNGDRIVLRNRLRLTEQQGSDVSVLRVGPAARNGAVYVNGQEVGSLPGWKAVGHDTFERDVREFLVAGENVIAIYCSHYRRTGQIPVRVSLSPSGNSTNYERSLDLSDAIATVHYRQEGVNYTREAFASAVDQVMVFRFTADQPGNVSFTASLDRLKHFNTQGDGDAGLLMTGQTASGRDDSEGLKFVARLRALSQGGRIRVVDDQLEVKGADEVILLVAAGTDYLGFAGRNTADPLQATLADIEQASQKSYKDMRANHIADYRRYFDRMKLVLEDGDEESRNVANLPTDQRHAALGEGQPDPALAALYFNFGRYLLISSSRPGCMPANLQGLWAEGIQTPWNCDYHLDINVQMNYWPAEMTGLGDCHTPLFKLIESLQEPGSETAKAYYQAKGWVAHVITNPWGFTAPGEQASWGATATGSPWLCDHLWEHYIYNPDTAFLTWAYPIMKGSAEFFLDMLIKDPKTGWLVTAPSNSPENRFKLPDGGVASVCMGPTMDMQILRELFDNCIEASRLLDTDTAFRERLVKVRAQLAPNQIGKHGQIQEWLEDYEEVDPHHRHVSQLYGLHPYDEINLQDTPELAKAAEISLQRRGDGGTGWSMAWKVNFWARLQDGDHALLMLNNLIKKGGDNLFCQHPPFQIDGNFGGTSGIGEMLLQSAYRPSAQESPFVLTLLPALPGAWPNGHVKGLRARGGFAVDMEWTDGILSQAVIHNDSPVDRTCTVRYGSSIRTIALSSGESVGVDK
jgi:alpha-L-fucosidase 2